MIRPVIAVLLLAGCAAQPPRVASTQWPQTVVQADKRTVREEIIAAFTANGAAVDQESDSLLQFRIPDTNADMAKAFFSCVSCPDPYLKANIVLAKVSSGTQVVAQYWRMIPQPNGSEERMEIEDNGDYNHWQEVLWRLRDKHRR